MDNQPLVSVIVPTYNRPTFLRTTIQAILNQTYPHLELIIISNGIHPHNKSVVEEFSDPRIRYADQENSGGPSSPRNHGIRLAQGQYIAFCDDDDVWLPQKLEQQISALEHHPEYGLCYTNMMRFDETGEWFLAHEQGAATLFSLLYCNTVPISSIVVRKSLVDKLHGFNESKQVGTAEDYELLLRYAAHTPFYHIDEHLIRYWSGNNRATRVDEDRKVSDIIRHFKNIGYCYYSVWKGRHVKLHYFIKPFFYHTYACGKMLGYYYFTLLKRTLRPYHVR